MQRSLDDRLIVRLDFVGGLPAEESIALALALIRQLREDPLLQNARIEIDQMEVGTWWINLRIVLGAIGALADSVPKLIEEIKAGKGQFGVLVAPTLDRHSGQSCQVISGDLDVILWRSEMSNGVAVSLGADGIRSAAPVLDTPKLNPGTFESEDGPADGGYEENPSGFWPSDLDTREQAFVGSFRFEGDDYVLDTADQSYKVEGHTADLPLESEREVTGIITSMDPPTLRVLGMTHTFPNGSRSETVFDADNPVGLFDQFVRDNLGTEINIPQSRNEPLRGPHRRVAFVGAFERGARDSYIFRREDGVPFEVWGINPKISLPLNIRLYVVGGISAEQPDRLEFRPMKMGRID